MRRMVEEQRALADWNLKLALLVFPLFVGVVQILGIAVGHHLASRVKHCEIVVPAE